MSAYRAFRRGLEAEHAFLAELLRRAPPPPPERCAVATTGWPAEVEPPVPKPGLYCTPYDVVAANQLLLRMAGCDDTAYIRHILKTSPYVSRFECCRRACEPVERTILEIVVARHQLGWPTQEYLEKKLTHLRSIEIPEDPPRREAALVILCVLCAVIIASAAFGLLDYAGLLPR